MICLHRAIVPALRPLVLLSHNSSVQDECIQAFEIGADYLGSFLDAVKVTKVADYLHDFTAILCLAFNLFQSGLRVLARSIE